MSEVPRPVALVRNPLTVIAVFAGLAEVSATIALPQLDPVVQGVFVWFVMLFPTLLVALFFVTLWVKHQVLYAPSDFANEENFMRNWIPDKSKDSGEYEDDFEEALGTRGGGDNGVDGPSALDTDSSQAESSVTRYHAVREAASLAVNHLERTLNVRFLRDVKMAEHSSIRFDAVGEGRDGPIFVEVKRVFTEARFLSVARSGFHQASANILAIPAESRRGATLILVLVVGPQISVERQAAVRSEIMERAMPLLRELEVKVEILNVSDLQR